MKKLAEIKNAAVLSKKQQRSVFGMSGCKPFKACDQNYHWSSNHCACIPDSGA